MRRTENQLDRVKINGIRLHWPNLSSSYLEPVHRLPFSCSFYTCWSRLEEAACRSGHDLAYRYGLGWCFSPFWLDLNRWGFLLVDHAERCDSDPKSVARTLCGLFVELVSLKANPRTTKKLRNMYAENTQKTIGLLWFIIIFFLIYPPFAKFCLRVVVSAPCLFSSWRIIYVSQRLFFDPRMRKMIPRFRLSTVKILYLTGLSSFVSRAPILWINIWRVQ